MEFILGLGMALPVVTSTGISVTTGIAQGVQEQKKQNADAANPSRELKFQIDVQADTSSVQGGVLNDQKSIVTLHDGRCWIDARAAMTAQKRHPFTGFYITYPDEEGFRPLGLVSTISVDPPLLNWIFVHRDTFEVRYANRSGSIQHLVGPYDWTPDQSCVTFQKSEGFVALEEDDPTPGPKRWGLYFDVENNGLQKIRKNPRLVKLQLVRRIITDQEVNKWGFREEGNIGFKATREV